MKVVCITNDVEATTIQGEAYNEDMAIRIVLDALPKTLKLYRDLNIKATFFCLGSLIEKHPDIISLIEKDGHEIACHGWSHDGTRAFDSISLEEQIIDLKKAKSVIDSVASSSTISFRAPALRVNNNTARALVASGFKIDSSVSSQRLDAFMSLGLKNKLLWLVSPRGVYRTSSVNLAKVGDGDVIEVPVSAWGLPYISTLLRVSPVLTKLIRYLLYFETRHSDKKLINFLFHPGEIMKIQSDGNIIKRSNNPIIQFFSGYLRAKIKNRNFGDDCDALMRRELSFWKDKGYKFLTISEAVNMARI